MDAVDHYAVLGLASGEEGAKLSEKEISKAYRAKALELHPDKRPDDPNAHDNFQKLKSSYEFLKDEKARKLFDDLLRVKRDQERRQSQQDAKRRKMVADLEERERAAFAPDPAAAARQEEERILRKLREEINRIREEHAKKTASASSSSRQSTTLKQNAAGASAGGMGSGTGLDKEKVLKVSWEKIGEGYSAERLKVLFSKFGLVEDVVIRSSKKRGSALVVMGSKDAVAAATRTVTGDFSNPLLVVPLQPDTTTFGQVPVHKPTETDHLSNLAGAGYKDFEDSVMQKLQRAAAKQR